MLSFALVCLHSRWTLKSVNCPNLINQFSPSTSEDHHQLKLLPVLIDVLCATAAYLMLISCHLMCVYFFFVHVSGEEAQSTSVCDNTLKSVMQEMMFAENAVFNFAVLKTPSKIPDVKYWNAVVFLFFFCPWSQKSFGGFLRGRTKAKSEREESDSASAVWVDNLLRLQHRPQSAARFTLPSPLLPQDSRCVRLSVRACVYVCICQWASPNMALTSSTPSHPSMTPLLSRSGNASSV